MGRAASLQASPPSQHHRHPASPRSSSPCSLDSQGAATTRMPMRSNCANWPSNYYTPGIPRRQPPTG
jgi:hypothetical protein